MTTKLLTSFEVTDLDHSTEPSSAITAPQREDVYKGLQLCSPKVSGQVMSIGRTLNLKANTKCILLGLYHTSFMGQYKEREDQDVLVPAVEPDGHQQTTHVAHGCATGAW
jgi:hypothetical protein